MLSYPNVIYEYFDPSNGLEFMKLMSLNEQEQDRVLVNLAAKLYQHIVDEITDIDFGDIPKSKGDITKIPNYIDLLDCINIIRNICIRFKESTDATDTILKAIDNLKDTKEIWKTSFNRNVALGMNTYNTLALSIVCSVSLIISTSIEYIKDPNTGEFDFVLNKVEHSKTLNSVLFRSLKSFNEGCLKGEFMNAIVAANNARRSVSESECMTFDEGAIMDALINASKDLIHNKLPDAGKTVKDIFSKTPSNGTSTKFVRNARIGIGVVSSLILLTAIVIPTIRNAISWFFNTKQKISDYFAIQAALVEMNANNLRYNECKSEEERNKIADKQMKWADKFRTLSNKLSTKMKTGETKAKNTLEKESQEKVSMDDIQSYEKVSNLF